MKIQKQIPALAAGKHKTSKIKLPSRLARIKPTGSFARKTVLLGLLALSAVSAANAQDTIAPVTQIEFPDDSVAMRFFCSAYAGQMKAANKIPAILEFIGAFEVFIPGSPSAELKISNEIALTAAEQKQLRQAPHPAFTENGTYLFTYILPQYLDSAGSFNTTGDGGLIQQGRLKVFKEKQPAKVPSDSSK